MPHELDCRGLACPEPVVRCRALLREASPASVTVLVDNAAALENVSRFLMRNGFQNTVEQISDNQWRISGTRNEIPQETQEEAAAASQPDGKTLVLLVTETLGRGDDWLGARLMVNFLGSLSQMGENLWRIILLNGAVKLTATEGEALDALRALEKSGVSILVCGTCLSHYGLLERKLVGETTNMLDVVTSLDVAQKVIRP